MNTCMYCGEQNSLGTVTCEHCDKPLEGIRTHPLDASHAAISHDFASELDSSDELILALHIDGVDKPLKLKIAPEVILGRFGPGNLQPRFVDLEDFGGYEKGVSRIHAAIRLREGRAILTDLNSANGTYINGHRLQANEEIVLFDRDKILLGMLSTEVRFDKKEQPSALKTGDVAKWLEVHPNTVRSWSTQYSDYLSNDAAGESGKPRVYSEDDTLILKTVAGLRGKGLNHEQIFKTLGKRKPAEEERSEPIFLVPISEQDKMIDRIHSLEIELDKLRSQRTAVAETSNINRYWLVVAVVIGIAATTIVIVLLVSSRG